MTLQRDNQSLNPKVEEQHLENLVSDILAEARQQGASAAEVGVSLDTGLSASIRKGEVDTVEFNCDRGFGITVYIGQRKGSASTSDSSAKAIKETVTAALNIAKYTSEDQYAGLADPKLMATDIPDLDLYHPWGINAEEAIDIAKETEAAAFKVSKKITNSEGASVSSHQGCRVYGNSHGFIGGYVSSRHSISCVLIAQEKEEMQRDYWYTVNREAQLLEAAVDVGRKAADRTLKRLGSQKVPTTAVPVLFSAELAGSLLSHFISAISGSSLYRQSSFLLDHLGKQIFPDNIHIHEQPRLTRAIGSAAFDNDGLATYDKDFVKEGVLANYMLGTYSSRRLKMESTANAGGAHNLIIDPTEPAADLLALVKKMDKGLLVTELMGQGVNIVTGDYSRGAAGFWVENGEIQYPVSEVTIAGNLKDIFNKIVAVGSDVDCRGNIRTGSILIESMTVAGH
ncbi:metalloprotease PmbA [Spartinivicinus poritis]|uniref:Metalloprotease PmbA n=1 Tax=Spartinivicinus poritis TaxID=2994640 RepID=A0ABT5U8Q1_9GAMM|nr:metalloprotease PmbA [Spartinivicinus sp. A2-2]MDE1462730.1 metalloprotease PmbA [Spartinivicinus sp. A2-2]